MAYYSEQIYFKYANKLSIVNSFLLHALKCFINPFLRKTGLHPSIYLARTAVWGHTVAVAVVQQLGLGSCACLFFIFIEKLMSFSLDHYGYKIIENITKKIWKKVNKMIDNLNKVFIIDRLDLNFCWKKFYNGFECFPCSQMSGPTQITIHYTSFTWNNWMK